MTLNEINAQIEALQAQAIAVRADALAEMRESIAVSGFTQDELFPVKRSGGRKASLGVPMFRDPDTGATWTGRGRKPAWIDRAVAA